MRRRIGAGWISRVANRWRPTYRHKLDSSRLWLNLPAWKLGTRWISRMPSRKRGECVARGRRGSSIEDRIERVRLSLCCNWHRLAMCGIR